MYRRCAMRDRLFGILISLILVLLVVVTGGSAKILSYKGILSYDSECMEILDMLAALEGFSYGEVEIAERLFGDEKINFEVETWKGKCYYGIGTLNGEVVIVSNKPFKSPTMLAYSDSKTVKLLFRNPNEKLFMEALKTGRIRIEGVGITNAFKVGLINAFGGFFMPRIGERNATLNITKPIFVFNFTSPDDYDGDGINNSADMCDPYLLKEKLNATGEIVGDEEVKYYLCPSFSSRIGEEYGGDSPYVDIYDYTTISGCGIKDTDGGLRYYTKGSICVESVGYSPSRIVEGPFGQGRFVKGEIYSECKRIYTDYCIDDKTLVEYYYEPPRRVVINNPLLGSQVVYISGGVRNKTYECPLGCMFGACLCKDVDIQFLYSSEMGEENGKVYWRRGIYNRNILEAFSSYPDELDGGGDDAGDYCLDETTLREFYVTLRKPINTSSPEECVLRSEDHRCDSCLDGVCISSGNIRIVDVDPVQVVYGAPLVKGKGTAFRVIINSTFRTDIRAVFELELPPEEWELPDNYTGSWEIEIPAHARTHEIMLPIFPEVTEALEPTLPRFFDIPVSPPRPTSIILGPYNVSYREVPRPVADNVHFKVRVITSLNETDRNDNEFRGSVDTVTTKRIRIMYFIHVWGKTEGSAEDYTNQNPHVKNFAYREGDEYRVMCIDENGEEILTIREAVERALDKAYEATEYVLGTAPIADGKIEYYINPVLYTIEEFADGNFTDPDVRDSAKREYLRNIKKFSSLYADYAVTLNPCTRGGQNWGDVASMIGAHPDASPAIVGHELLSHQISGFHEECYRCNPYRLPNNGQVCCETCDHSNREDCPYNKWCNSCDVDCESCVASEGFWVNKWRKYEEGRWEDGRIVGSKYYACGYIPVDITWQRLGSLWKYNSQETLSGGYLGLMNNLSSSEDPTVLLVKGEVYRDGKARFGSFWIREGFEDGLSDTGDYYIVLRDSHGNIIRSYGFTPTFFETTEEHEIREINSSFFTYSVLWDENIRKIEIVDKNYEVLDERYVSKNKPEIRVLSPKDGDLFGDGDIITIEWSGYDLDGDTLTYIVEMSRDGKTWTPLTGELREEMLAINANHLSRGEYVVKVSVSDGVNTAEALSGRFFVDVPEVKIEREVCGNNFCNTEFENSLNCPQDCPTGIKDSICDAVKDNRVDPDCKEGEDPDDTSTYEAKIAEKHGESDRLIYGLMLGGSLILSGVFVGVYRFVKGRRNK
jgi:hypothetical protein